MKVLMCHPISWKVNFRPLLSRSRPEWHRGGFHPGARSAPSNRRSGSLTPGALGEGGGRLWLQLNPFAFGLLGLAWR